MLLYPNYNQFDLTLSKLGTKYPSLLFFNAAMVINALTSCYVLIILRKDIEFMFNGQKREVKTIIIMYSIMIVCMIGIIIFPSSGVTSDIHTIIAVILFFSMAIATSWFSSIAKAVIPKWNENISNLGYVCAISVIFLALFLAFWEFGPFIQKITVTLFTIWVVLTVYELQKHRKILSIMVKE
jgi:hypothetical protein